MFDILSEQFSEEKAFEYCEAMLSKPPVTIRINPEKTGRKDLRNILMQKYSLVMENTKESKLGLNLKENKMLMSLLETDEYKHGLYEM